LHPSGAFTLDQKITKENGERLRDEIAKMFAGPHNAARFLILDQGMRFQGMSVSPEDAEFLGSRRFTVEEICRIYNFPPTVVADLTNSSFNNSETLMRQFAEMTILPWLRKIEREFARSVLGNGRQLEMDLSGLLRGDPVQRWQAWQIALQNNVLTPDEVR